MEEIFVYLWRLQATAKTEEFTLFLSPDERSRADRFVKPEDAVAYRIGRGRLRQILAKWVGGAPDRLHFDYGPSGKPALLRGPFFNLSHSNGLAALAIRTVGPVGLDIEAPRPVEDGVARRFFSAAEYAALLALAPDDWQAGFFRCWTRKEAVVKALGIGLGAPLDRFDVTLDPTARPLVTRMEIEGSSAWALAHLEIAPNMPGAVAVPNPVGPLRLVLRPDPDVPDCQWFA